jgi:hypothetical protein
MAGRSAEITVDSIRVRARMLGLDVGDADLAGLVDRLRAAADDVDTLDELELQDREPAVGFSVGKDEDRS